MSDNTNPTDTNTVAAEVTAIYRRGEQERKAFLAAMVCETRNGQVGPFYRTTTKGGALTSHPFVVVAIDGDKVDLAFQRMVGTNVLALFRVPSQVVSLTAKDARSTLAWAERAVQSDELKKVWPNLTAQIWAASSLEEWRTMYERHSQELCAAVG